MKKRLASKLLYKLLLVILLSPGYSFLFAQETYSRTYDLEVGVNNLVGTLIIEEDEFLIASNHSGDTSIVSALTRFDMLGITGKLVFSQYAGEEKVTLDSQRNGMYIVKIKFKNGNRRTEKLILNK